MPTSTLRADTGASSQSKALPTLNQGLLMHRHLVSVHTLLQYLALSLAHVPYLVSSLTDSLDPGLNVIQVLFLGLREAL